jgi:hypothetical protein
MIVSSFGSSIQLGLVASYIYCTFPNGRQASALQHAARDNKAGVNKNGSILNQNNVLISVPSV